MARLQICVDDIFEAHRAPGYHPERPERLAAVRECLAAATLSGAVAHGTVRAADSSELVRVHRPNYLKDLEARVRGRAGWLDADTYFCESSWDAALAAAGASCQGALDVLAGDVRASLVLVRPPGHHAEADQAMGFCLINNVAVAAAAARAAGTERVAIVDWDVHHGNGTQHIFESDPSVLFISLHQYPFYPGTGAPGEIGRDLGEGATVNVGLPAGSRDSDYLFAMDNLVVPTLRAYKPELVLISAGFDAAARDPLAGMRLTEEGFRQLAARVRAVADEVSDARIAAILEGGYHLGDLSGAVVALADVLSAEEPARGLGAKSSGQVHAPVLEAAQAAVFATLRAHRNARNRWVPTDVLPARS